MINIEYKDEDGKVLYGYSAQDLTKLHILLEENTKEIKKSRMVSWALVIILVLLILLGFALIKYIDYHNILTNTVRILGNCS